MQIIVAATAAGKTRSRAPRIIVLRKKFVRLNPQSFTAAHRTLPFGTKVKVMNNRNGRSIVVTINDRGPFVRGRVIDVTPAAARLLGFSGLAPVTLEVENQFL